MEEELLDFIDEKEDEYLSLREEVQGAVKLGWLSLAEAQLSSPDIALYMSPTRFQNGSRLTRVEFDQGRFRLVQAEAESPERIFGLIGSSSHLYHAQGHFTKTLEKAIDLINLRLGIHERI